MEKLSFFLLSEVELNLNVKLVTSPEYEIRTYALMWLLSELYVKSLLEF